MDQPCDLLCGDIARREHLSGLLFLVDPFAIPTVNVAFLGGRRSARRVIEDWKTAAFDR